MTERREHFALDWIKRELDETLKTARVALEAYAESSGDETRMRTCLTHLHQVHGTLLMLELTGVAVLSDEMEQLAQALLGGAVVDKAAAQQALMQGILQLPAFLEDIQKGLPDSRRAVVPLANELRLARGEKAFPDAGTGAKAQAAPSEESLKRFEQIEGTEKARKIRAAYQQVLLSILRGQDRRVALGTLSKVAVGLERIAEKTPVEPMWRAFNAFVKSLGQSNAQLSADVVKVLRRVDAEIKVLAQEGTAALRRPVDLDLVRQLLTDARSRGYAGPELEELAPVVDEKEEGEEVRAGISRREATQTAAVALREEIALVKDRLDLFVRTEKKSVDDLVQLAAPLKQIGSTLSILGFESSRAIVADQCDAINRAATSGKIEDAMVLSAASALLQVDENLAALAHDRNHRLGAQGEASAVIGAAQIAVLNEARNGLEQVKQAVVDYVSAQWDVRHLEGAPDLIGAVGGALAMVPLAQAAEQLGRCADYVRERLLAGVTPDWTALDNFADAISGIDYFLERLIDSAGMPSQDILGGVERSLAALGFGAGMVREPPPRRAPVIPISAAAAPVAAPASNVVSIAPAPAPMPPPAAPVPESPAPVVAAPTPMAATGAANAPSGVAERVGNDVPRERLRLVLDDDEDAPHDPVSVEEIEDDAFDLGSTLFDEAEPQREPVTADAADELAEMTAPAKVEAKAAMPTRPPPRSEPVRPAPAIAARADRPAVTVDDDIVEIFVEEVSEVLETIGEWLPRWTANATDETALAEVRRSFHTLKGSGRIVGATVIGELAWSIENMLNRVIDGTIVAHPQIARVAREAFVLVPALRSDFEARRASDESAVAAIVERADLLASGGTLEETAPTDQPAPAPIVKAERPPEPTQEIDTFAIFDEEAAAHLDLLDARIGSHDAASVLSDEALRALHTLRGSAGMAGIESVSRIADPVYQVARAAREAGVSPTPDLIDFIQQGVFALRRTVKALRDGETPDEEFDLFAREAERLIAGVEAKPRRASSVLNLEGAATLVDARAFLSAWRAGASDLGKLSETIAALHELRNEAESHALGRLTLLCDALLETYERFEDQPLDAASFDAFDGAHEQLLTMFDCIAAEQELPDPQPSIAALRALTVALPVVEELEPDEPAEAPEDTMSTIIAETAEPPPKIEPIAVAPEDTVPVLKRPAPSEPLVIALPEDADPEILSIFFEEAEELLETMDQGIQEWIDDRANRVHVEKLLRSLHTLKGGARLAGLMDLGEETHAFESFVVAAQDGEQDDAFFATLHDRYDHINAHVLGLKRASSGGAPEELPSTAPLAAAPKAAPAKPIVADTASTPTPAVAPAPAAPARTGAPRPVAPSPAPSQPVPMEVEELESEAVQFGTRKTDGPATLASRSAADSEMVRVSAPLLELLVDLAGESSIVRSRIEQGINDFAGALDEMEITIERLREQLRRLEIETETQVLFRRETSHGPDYDEFDPLEMDRYSQLQQLSRGLTESASDMFDLKETLANKARESETLLLQQARLNTEIQEGLMRTRMVPFSRLLPRLRRIVRQVAKDLGKEVEFHAYNAEGELDRNVLERMVPPLEHMLRNAIDHGIERPELRRNYAKPPAGRIDLRLSREGADVVIEISDDGAGIDVESVHAKAVERGLMANDAQLKEEEILQFVFAPGFSTARSVTQISGRGVGLDVVHSAVKQMGGSVSISSVPGKGTRFVIRLPFTVSVNRALMVSVGEDLYAVPLNTIEGIVRVPAKDIEAFYQPNGPGFEYAGIQYRIRYLGSFLGREYVHSLDRGTVPVVLVRAGDRAMAVHVDGVQGSREIVVKSLGPQFAGVGGISGATILGDGSVVVILDLLALVRTQAAAFSAAPLPEKAQRPISVMVVDDSVTVRKVTSRLLERQGMEVMLAKDGVEAIAMLQERRPDIVLLDIEMPRMDGFEVARQIRHDERLKRLPIIMITSRTGTKHQERAAEIGVNRFLGKPFQENELLASIDDLVRGGAHSVKAH